VKIGLAQVGLPALDAPDARPVLASAEYGARLAALQSLAGADRVVVYGDREHFANLAFFCGFDPRFEEALLVVGGSRPVLLVGNEGLSYASLLPIEAEVVLCPSLSLMAQDRSGGPRLADALRAAGVGRGAAVGIVGWKSLEPDEWEADVAPLAVPAFVVDTIRHLVGPDGTAFDATRIVTNPVDGLRAFNTADQIAAFEWAASRASRAIARVVRAIGPGITEQEAVGAMAYEGEPLSAHVMFSSGPEVAVGLRSPTARRLQRGDAATTAVGFWGGLCCRAGLIEAGNGESGSPSEAYLERLAIPYWRAIATWYESVRLGETGGAIDMRIRETLAPHGFGPALNPGHLTHLDEWVHSQIRPGSADPVRSGMVFQCDIIPDNAREGWAANCEDTVAVADEALRDELSERHSDVAARIDARRRLLHDRLGIEIADEILPLSCLPAYFPPFWLAADLALVREG
jgi:Xaa-Pro aminopeptidase